MPDDHLPASDVTPSPTGRPQPALTAGASAEKARRLAREAAALRANLQRRKQQSRDRRIAEPAAAMHEIEPTPELLEIEPALGYREVDAPCR